MKRATLLGYLMGVIAFAAGDVVWIVAGTVLTVAFAVHTYVERRVEKEL